VKDSSRTESNDTLNLSKQRKSRATLQVTGLPGQKNPVAFFKILPRSAIRAGINGKRVDEELDLQINQRNEPFCIVSIEQNK
jgi:hypothetical protein